MKKYLTKKNNNYSCHLPCIHFGIKKLQFRFKFDGNCLYPIVDTDDDDLNKLFGWSFGYHHKNSIRIAWRPDEKDNTKIQVHSYMYNEGKRTMNYIFSVDVDKWYVMDIEILLCCKVSFTLLDDNEYLLARTTENF